MGLKLSNFLDNIELFLNECYLYSESTDTGILNTELHHIDYSINENKIQLLNYVLDNFHEFEMVFSYSEKEFNEISKLLSDKNTYKSMYLEIVSNLSNQLSNESSNLIKKINHLKEDYFLNLQNVANNKFIDTCFGFHDIYPVFINYH